MRLQKVEPNSLEYEELNRFSNWILEIEYGQTVNNDANNKDKDEDTSIIEIPRDLLLYTTENKIEKLVDFVFPYFKKNTMTQTTSKKELLYQLQMIQLTK